MKFPTETQDAIKECILNIIWAKDDILAFLKKHGCTKADLAPIRKPQDLTRSKILYTVFKQLSYRPDEGLIPFMNMNRALLNWRSFNKHYFVDLKKLNKEDAEKAIADLVEAQFYLEK